MSDLLTIKDVADIMQISEDAVSKRFKSVDGVINLGRRTKGRRHYDIIRIPKTVLERYLSTKAGRSITVTVPERPERRRRHGDWERKAILNLAKAAKQNGVSGKDRETFTRIGRHARALVLVPECYWDELATDWLDESEDYINGEEI